MVFEDIGNEVDEMMEYFNWFFKNLFYLRELRNNFVSCIFNFLFKYFYNVLYNVFDCECFIDLVMFMLNLSVVFYCFIDSVIMGIFGWSLFCFLDIES